MRLLFLVLSPTRLQLYLNLGLARNDVMFLHLSVLHHCSLDDWFQYWPFKAFSAYQTSQENYLMLLMGVGIVSHLANGFQLQDCVFPVLTLALFSHLFININFLLECIFICLFIYFFSLFAFYLYFLPVQQCILCTGLPCTLNLLLLFICWLCHKQLFSITYIL